MKPSTIHISKGKPRGIAAAVMVVLVSMLLLPLFSAAQTTINREYTIKAAFLFNFAQFVEWPSNAFTTNATFVIGVVGSDPFDDTLDKMVKDESIGGRRMAVQRSRNVDELKHCQILFISRSEASRVRQILTAIESRPVLTVSETEGFGQMGGMVNFYREASKVRFEINPRAAERHGLKISSELIRIGKIVE